MRLTLLVCSHVHSTSSFFFYLSVRHDSHDTFRTNSRVLFTHDVILLATLNSRPFTFVGLPLFLSSVSLWYNSTLPNR